jgi:hypothetical protein
MDWAWVIEKTIQFTIANIMRLKKDAANYISSHPTLTIITLIILLITITAGVYFRERQKVASKS